MLETTRQKKAIISTFLHSVGVPCNAKLFYKKKPPPSPQNFAKWNLGGLCNTKQQNIIETHSGYQSNRQGHDFWQGIASIFTSHIYHVTKVHSIVDSNSQRAM